MKIAILNDIHIGSSLERNGKIRAPAHEPEDFLPKILQDIIQQHSPKLFINLGDLIHSKDFEADTGRYKKAIRCFKQTHLPTIHVVGNHELKTMSLSDIEKIWKEEKTSQKSYGVHDIEGIRIVWIGLEIDPSNPKHCRLPSEQLNWLNQTLTESASPTLLLSHCAIDDQVVDGNYFYEQYLPRSRTGFFLTNQQDILKVISKSGCVFAVIQAHLHYFHTKIIDQTYYVTCPSMRDNICSPAVQEHMPEIYTILSFDSPTLSIKSYSREYCFAGTELNFRK